MTASPATSASRLSRSDLCVLVVDDDPLVVLMNRKALSRMGVNRIETAANGQDALKVLSSMSTPPDVILSDLNMPGMDGVELLRHVAERRLGAGVIISSGEERRLLGMVHELALQHGLVVLGVLPKPMTFENLLKMLNDFSGASSEAGPPTLARISEDEFDTGLNSGSLMMVYQPKVQSADGRVIGVEALARWVHPDRGTLGPAAFVPLAEETGRTGALTHAVLRRACNECGAWKAAGFDIGVAVNVTADDLQDVSLPDFAASCVSEANLFSHHLTLEVTESRIMRNLKATMETLTRLRLKGIGLSIDDFGTGYASLEQLKRAPFTEVKVDRAFVNGASGDATTRTILESSISLGRKLNMRVVAEGVEQQADWDLLVALECEIVQGYYVTPPMSADDLRVWLTSRANNNGSK